MAQRIINIGSGPNTKDGDTVRQAFSLTNQNFTELYQLLEVASLTELAQDYAASMFINGTHEGITVEYNDNTNKLNLTVVQDFDGGSASTVYDDNITIDGGGA